MIVEFSDQKISNPNRDYDFLYILIILSRLPLIVQGYGSDGDGWRVALSATTIWIDGIYHPSRFPGFPVYEIINAPLVGLGGYLLSNAATMVVFLVAVILFRKILIKLQVPSVHLLQWTFAFMPIFWKNSSVTMDYIWGMALILLSIYLLLEKKISIASIVLGLAVGTRLTHLIFILPIFFLIDPPNRIRKMILFGAITCLISTICYLPVVIRPEFISEIKIYIADIRKYTIWQQIMYFVYRVIYAVGLIGSISIIISLWISRHRLKELFNQDDRRILFSFAAILIMFIVFFVLADEREYLIPIIPFILLVIGIVLPSKYLTITCLCLLSYSFVNVDLIEHGFGKQRFAPHLTSGFVLADYQMRRDLLEIRETLPNVSIGDSSIIMTGMGPMLWFQNTNLMHSKEVESKFEDDDASVSSKHPGRYFVYKLTSQKCQSYQMQRYKIYYLSGIKNYLESFLFYNLDSLGALPIEFRLN